MVASPFAAWIETSQAPNAGSEISFHADVQRICCCCPALRTAARTRRQPPCGRGPQAISQSDGRPLRDGVRTGRKYMTHDPRILKHQDSIAAIRDNLPDWIKRLERPAAPVLMPKFGPLEGIRAVGTGVLVAQAYIGTKLAEFGAEVIHVERPG